MTTQIPTQETTQNSPYNYMNWLNLAKTKAKTAEDEKAATLLINSVCWSALHTCKTHQDVLDLKIEDAFKLMPNTFRGLKHIQWQRNRGTALAETPPTLKDLCHWGKATIIEESPKRTIGPGKADKIEALLNIIGLQFVPEQAPAKNRVTLTAAQVIKAKSGQIAQNG